MDQLAVSGSGASTPRSVITRSRAAAPQPEPLAVPGPVAEPDDVRKSHRSTKARADLAHDHDHLPGRRGDLGRAAGTRAAGSRGAA